MGWRVRLGRGSFAGAVVAARVDGEVKTLLDWRGVLAASVAASASPGCAGAADAGRRTPGGARAGRPGRPASAILHRRSAARFPPWRDGHPPRPSREAAPTVIDPSARVHASADLEPDVVVGPRTSIWHRAQVRVGARIGAECVIGRDAFIDEGVTIGDRVKIQNLALVYHGVTVEDGVFIGPNAILTNDRFPRAITADGRPRARRRLDREPDPAPHGLLHRRRRRRRRRDHGRPLRDRRRRRRRHPRRPGPRPRRRQPGPAARMGLRVRPAPARRGPPRRPRSRPVRRARLPGLRPHVPTRRHRRLHRGVRVHTRSPA